APVKSLIEHAMSLDAAPSINLYWLATRPDGHFMGKLVRSWTEALDAFDATLLDEADPARGALAVAAAMRAELFDIDCDCYLAGPQAFVATLAETLARIGVPGRQIRSLVL
ncbi:MAG: hypothetical protein KDF63_17735, partial [Rhodoferax sp.]|nr:hypothetical protein [Rhodoferax sp.]